MKVEVKMFLELVKAALKQEIHPQAIANGPEVYRLARENGLSGLIFPVLDQNLLDPQVYRSFQKDFYEYLTKDAKQTAATALVHNWFSEKGIAHIFLKGAFLKPLYPASYMRSMGDIDILIKAEDLPEVHEILEAHAYRNWSNSASHDCFHNGKGVFLEIHPRLDAEVDSKYDSLFENPWDWAELREGYRYDFSPEYHLAYLLYHMAKHLISSGIGFRSLLDLSIMVEKMAIDWDKAEDLLQKAGLSDFAQTMFGFCREYFGGDKFPISGEVDAELLEEFTAYLVRSGIHGIGENFNPFIPRMLRDAQGDDVRKGRRQTIFRMIFPKRSVLQDSYPYLKKRPWLLPWAWLSRFLRLAFKQRKSSIRKIKKLKVKDEALIEQRDLMRKIGL
jgi:hypothetical protein